MPKIKFENSTKELVDIPMLDDLWILIANFLDYPSLANLRRVSKDFQKIVVDLFSKLIEKNPTELNRRIAEIDAMALRKFKRLGRLMEIEGSLRGFIELLRDSSSAPLFSAWAPKKLIDALNQNRLEGTTTIKYPARKGHIAWGIAFVCGLLFFLYVILRTTGQLQKLSSNEQKIISNLMMVLMGVEVFALISGGYFFIQQKRHITQVINASSLNNPQEKTPMNPLQGLFEEFNKALENISRNSHKVSTERFRLFGIKQEIQRSRNLVIDKELSDVFNEMLKLLIDIKKNEGFFNKLPIPLTGMISAYFVFLEKNREHLSLEMQTLLDHNFPKQIEENKDKKEVILALEEDESSNEENANSKETNEDEDISEKDVDEETPLIRSQHKR